MKKYIISGMMLLATMTLAAQGDLKTIKGQVVDASTGTPLAGVIVSAYGENAFTAMTDEDGCYVLKAPQYVRSVIMRVEGYNLLQRAISDSIADARLYHESFAAQYKRNTVATVSSEASQFANTSAASIDPLIAQQLGGDVRTMSRGGNIGLGNVMLLSGINSLNANAQPLIVVDDVIMDMQYSRTTQHDGYYNNLLTNLNVNDIESVEVLKNGTALYGAKGANGVILIHTKRNKSMATKIDVNINGRYELIPRLPQMMSAEDYRLYASELLSNQVKDMSLMKFLSMDPTYYYYNLYHNDTDWKDEVYRNAFSQNYGINVQGGDNVASYNLSVGYSLANSTLKENDYSRFNMRLNSDIEITRKLKVRFDAAYSDVDRSLFDDGAPSSILSGVATSPGFLGLAKSPFLSPYAFDNNGRVSHYYAEADDYLEGLFQNRGRLANPSAILDHGVGENRNSQGCRLINFSVMPRFEVNKHLTVSEHFALNLVSTDETYYLPHLGVPNYYVDELDATKLVENVFQSQASNQTAIQSDTRISWKNQYGAHQVGVKGGFRLLSNSYKLTSARGYTTGSDKTPSFGSQFRDTSGDSDNTMELMWYALGDYNYAQRYYVNAGISAHASSRFGKDVDGLKLGGVVWGLFPSIEAAWVLTNEQWFSPLKGIDYLRLSVGYDESGNDDINPLVSRSYFVSTRMMNNKATGLVIGNIGNTELQWETTRRLTGALEGNFIDNRVNVRLNLFKSWTSNLLALRQLAWTSGLHQNWSNGGKLENAGFDVSASVKALNLKDWHWEIGASAGHYNNKVTSLPDQDQIKTEVLGATILTEVGKPVGQFYGYRTKGVFSTTADAKTANLYLVDETNAKKYFAAGDVIFEDVNPYNAKGEYAPGQIDENDRVVIGDPNPDIYGNIFTTLNWKRLTFRAVFNYSIGNDVFNYQRSLLEGGTYFLNQTTAVNSRWTTEGQVTSVPRVNYKDPMGNSRFSDRWIEDGSYLRLSSVTLSYFVPIQSTYLQGLTIWGNASNLFTLTRYLGSDPDCSMGNGVLSQGIDRGILAAGRSFSLGVNINL